MRRSRNKTTYNSMNYWLNHTIKSDCDYDCDWLVFHSFFSFHFISLHFFSVRCAWIWNLLLYWIVAMSLRFCRFDIDLITFDLNKGQQKETPRFERSSRGMDCIRKVRGWNLCSKFIIYDCHFPPLLSHFKMKRKRRKNQMFHN